MNADLNGLRPRMMSVAYRMLGSVADAEDAVQEAFLSLQTVDEVSSPEGFLVKATTRKCIDQLRADQRRNKYVGPWVPEPVNTKCGGQQSVLADSLTQAFLLMLERLSPEERAAFLLRTVFDYEYADIAEILGKSEVNVRQILRRAKQRIGRDETRFRHESHEADLLAERFIAACQAGDMRLVEQLLTEGIEVHSDGGGKVRAARVVVRGRNLAARFLVGLFRKRWWNCELQSVLVNGEPGFVLRTEGHVIQVVSLCIKDGVAAIYMTNNPDKLSRWSVAEIE